MNFQKLTGKVAILVIKCKQFMISMMS